MPAPTISCPDQKGLVAKIANFTATHKGNIIHADHHTDFANQLFWSRLEWSLEGFDYDEGPIIEQEVVRVSHRDSSAAFIRKGKDVERSVLGRAVRLHLQNRVLVYSNRTVVFD